MTHVSLSLSCHPSGDMLEDCDVFSYHSLYELICLVGPGLCDRLSRSAGSCRSRAHIPACPCVSIYLRASEVMRDPRGSSVHSCSLAMRFICLSPWEMMTGWVSLFSISTSSVLACSSRDAFFTFVVTDSQIHLRQLLELAQRLEMV